MLCIFLISSQFYRKQLFVSIPVQKHRSREYIPHWARWAEARARIVCINLVHWAERHRIRLDLDVLLQTSRCTPSVAASLRHIHLHPNFGRQTRALASAAKLMWAARSRCSLFIGNTYHITSVWECAYTNSLTVSFDANTKSMCTRSVSRTQTHTHTQTHTWDLCTRAFMFLGCVGEFSRVLSVHQPVPAPAPWDMINLLWVFRHRTESTGADSKARARKQCTEMRTPHRPHLHQLMEYMR